MDDILVTRPCVGSGFCCKKSPCPYGERDPSSGWCLHLVPWEGDDLGVPRYRCGRYDFIRTQPFWQYVPAFGGGCSSPLFNDDRDRVIRALVKRSLPMASGALSAPPGGISSDPMDDLERAYPWALRVERFEDDRIAPTVRFIVPRDEWPPGPWQGEPDLVEWRMEDVPYPLLIVRGHGGTLCGYVGVPPEHPLRGQWFRGRVTFHWSELSEDILDARPCGPVFMPTGEAPTCWWLGFHSSPFPAFPSQPPAGVPIHYVTLAEFRPRVEAFAVALSRVPGSTFPG